MEEGSELWWAVFPFLEEEEVLVIVGMQLLDLPR